MKLGTLIPGREFKAGNTVIQSRAFEVGHATTQGYPK